MRLASQQILRDLRNADHQLLENVYRTATASKCMSEVRELIQENRIQLNDEKVIYQRADGTTGWYKTFHIDKLYLPDANRILAKTAGLTQQQ